MRALVASASLILSGALAVLCFLNIVRRYRKISGFPWLSSLGFAAAATAALYCLRVLASVLR